MPPQVSMLNTSCLNKESISKCLGKILKRNGVMKSPESIHIKNGTEKLIKVNLYRPISKQVRMVPVKKAITKKVFSTVISRALKNDLNFVNVWVIEVSE
jgi:uncharacterized alkaline shock family protein YloU